MGRSSPAANAAKTKLTASWAIALRNTAVDDMSPGLRKKFTQIELAVNDLRATNLEYYYRIGQYCEEIKANPDKYNSKSGTSGLKRIEQALSAQARTLRKAALFARTYDSDSLKELIALHNPKTEFRLHWGHVSFLLTVPEADKRKKFANEAVDKMLDAPALHQLIKKRTQRSGGHGRTHAIPATIPAQLRQMQTISKQWSDKNAKVWNGEEESVFGNLLNMPVDEMEPDMLEQIDQIVVLMREISVEAGENVERLQRAREHLRTSIEQRDRQAEVAVAGRPARDIDLSPAPAATRRARRATASV